MFHSDKWCTVLCICMVSIQYYELRYILIYDNKKCEISVGRWWNINQQLNNLLGLDDGLGEYFAWSLLLVCATHDEE